MKHTFQTLFPDFGSPMSILFIEERQHFVVGIHSL